MLIVFADETFEKSVVIGKSRSPRCFRRLDKNKFPVIYYANNKAWMTSTIFTKILRNLNEKMRKENRSILLFLGNVTCHPKIILSNIKLVFFPPNTTSKLQLLNSEIIQNLKCNYRKLMLKNFH